MIGGVFSSALILSDHRFGGLPLLFVGTINRTVSFVFCPRCFAFGLVVFLDLLYGIYRDDVFRASCSGNHTQKLAICYRVFCFQSLGLRAVYRN